MRRLEEVVAGNEWWYLNGLAREVWCIIRSGSVRESVCPRRNKWFLPANDPVLP